MDKLKALSFDKLTALSLSIGGLAGVATFLAVGPLSGIFFIWAATIAWAAYFFLGATKEALINTIVCGIFGVFMAWFTAILLTNIPSDATLGLSSHGGHYRRYFRRGDVSCGNYSTTGDNTCQRIGLFVNIRLSFANTRQIEPGCTAEYFSEQPSDCHIYLHRCWNLFWAVVSTVECKANQVNR